MNCYEIKEFRLEVLYCFINAFRTQPGTVGYRYHLKFGKMISNVVPMMPNIILHFLINGFIIQFDIGIVNSSKNIPFSCIFPMLLHLILDYGYFLITFLFSGIWHFNIFLIKKQISYSINLANICMIIQPSYRCSYSFGIAMNQRFR